MDLYVEDFTEKNYKMLLRKIQHKSIFYSNINKNKKFTLWRHDVDFSVNRALSLAKIEKIEGVNATYFFQLGSFFYNVFEQNIKEKIFQIKELGHEIALHFDPTQYNIETKEDLEKYLLYEKNILEFLLNTRINTFSFHNPTPSILEFKDWMYAGMVNAYAQYFKENVEYCSDSNGYWRHTRLEDFLKKRFDKIQVLTHPEWWQNKPMHPRQRIFRAIYGRSEFQLKMYDDMLLQNNRKNQGANSNILFLLKYFLNDNFVICEVHSHH